MQVETSQAPHAPATTAVAREAASLPPDSVPYRLKRRMLGKPLHSEELEHQRLGKPTALAVSASDNLSSSAYATEEILHVLIPVAGAVAFSLVVPVTLAMCVVLGFLILFYRETIREYPSAGGAYLVTKDRSRPVPAGCPQHDAPVLELILDDGTAAISVVFLGRRRLAGVDVGAHMVVDGTVGRHRNRLGCSTPPTSCASRCGSRRLAAWPRRRVRHAASDASS